MRQFLKKNLPEPLLAAIRDGRDFIDRLPEIPSANLHPWRRDTVSRLKKLENKYEGERCFILGNGPSLRNTDLSKLRHEYTFGMNRIYLAFPDMGFPTTFFVSVNDLVIQQTARDIQNLDMPKFVSWRARQWLQPREDLYYLYTTYTGPTFARKITARVWEGATVTYVALQIAFYLGFSEAILIGVDHNFTTQGKPNETVVSQGDDPNHFHPGYFGKGFRWQLPDLETSELAYRMARDAFINDKRKVIDATVGGKLTVFPKVEYSSLF
jgi:hypothetical protein